VGLADKEELETGEDDLWTIVLGARELEPAPDVAGGTEDDAPIEELAVELGLGIKEELTAVVEDADDEIGEAVGEGAGDDMDGLELCAAEDPCVGEDEEEITTLRDPLPLEGAIPDVVLVTVLLARELTVKEDPETVFDPGIELEPRTDDDGGTDEKAVTLKEFDAITLADAETLLAALEDPAIALEDPITLEKGETLDNAVVLDEPGLLGEDTLKDPGTFVLRAEPEDIVVLYKLD
jgi:hypothetical protein